MEKTKTFPILGRMGELKISASKLAKELGICRSRCHALVNGETEFKASEIKKACEILFIKTEDIPRYFFTLEASEKDEESFFFVNNGSKEGGINDA